MNKVEIIGNLGNDPEIRYSGAGTAVCNFSVATTESWKGKDGSKKEKTEWHRVVVWGNQAENCAKYLTKGRQVLIEGKIETRNWDDRDGNKRYTTEIIARKVLFLGGSRTEQPLTQNEEEDVSTSAAAEEIFGAVQDDDIPF
jgi:single-strand DNA-binding protein